MHLIIEWHVRLDAIITISIIVEQLTQPRKKIILLVAFYIMEMNDESESVFIDYTM